MTGALAMEPIDIYLVLKDYVMSCYTKELLILFKIMISLLCNAYKSIQVFAGILLLFSKFFLAMVQVEPNRYLSDLSSSSEGSLGRLEESKKSSRSIRDSSTKCHKIRRKFNKRVQFFSQRRGVMFL